MTDRANLTDTVARTGRATGQTGLGFALIDLLDAFHPLTTHQFGALVAVAGVVVAAVQNWLENRGTIPTLLKTTPAEPTPVVATDIPKRRRAKDAGLIGIGVALLVVIVVAALLLGFGSHPLFFLLLLLVLVVLVV